MLLVLLGVAAAITSGGTFGQVLTFVLISSGFVLATSLVFYEVGLSEDREHERERERQEARRTPKPKRPTRAPRRRLPRLRGQSRRLR